MTYRGRTQVDAFCAVKLDRVALVCCYLLLFMFAGKSIGFRGERDG